MRAVTRLALALAAAAAGCGQAEGPPGPRPRAAAPEVKPAQAGETTASPAPEAAAANPAGPSLAGDWPSFRGSPSLDGWREGEIAKAPRLLWTFEAGSEIESTAAIAGDLAVVGSAEGVMALALEPGAASGKEVWRVKTEAPVRSSPGIRGGKAYFGDDAGRFRCVELKTGEEAWSFAAGKVEIVSSPTFTGDKVLFGSYDASLYALGAEDGKVAWKFETEAQVHATPAIADGSTFIAGCDGELRAIEIATGQQSASIPMGAYSAASPAVSGDRVVVGTFGKQVLCVDWRTGKQAWAHEGKNDFASSAALRPAAPGRKGLAVLGGRDKALHAFDLESGKEVWSFSSRAKVEASPVIVGSKVIAAGTDGDLHFLDVETGVPVWTYAAGGGFAASPAVGRGRLVIANDEGLVHCFDLRPEP